MALAFYFAPTTPMSAGQYDECITRLRKAGAGHPPGRLYHACFGSPERLTVFDVWTSQAAFEAFGQTLMPIMQQIGADPGQPSVMPVHNVIVPPAKKAAAKKPAAKRPAAKKAASKKPSARKRGATRRR
jgi:hypothetical protein